MPTGGAPVPAAVTAFVAFAESRPPAEAIEVDKPLLEQTERVTAFECRLNPYESGCSSWTWSLE